MLQLHSTSAVITKKLVDILETVSQLIVADMSTDEWSIDTEGKYSLNTTVYSPVVGSYMFNPTRDE